jgi:hypothetical protein
MFVVARILNVRDRPEIKLLEVFESEVDAAKAAMELAQKAYNTVAIEHPFNIQYDISLPGLRVVYGGWDFVELYLYGVIAVG